MKIRPLFDRVLIQRIDEPSQTNSGLFLPESAKEKPLEGKVLAAGNGRIGNNGGVTPLSVKVGDTVAFGKYSGTEITVGGEEHLIMREDDLLGIIEG